MAKDSNKRRVLDRRKEELDHALKHDLAPAAIARRAEKVRAAAIAVIKKYRGPFAHVEGGPGNTRWRELEQRWDQLTIDEIVEIVRRWPPRPALRDVYLMD